MINAFNTEVNLNSCLCFIGQAKLTGRRIPEFTCIRNITGFYWFIECSSAEVVQD